MIRETAQAKIDAALVSGLSTAPWWLQFFDHPTDVVLFLIAVAVGLSRLAIMWLQYRNNKKGG